MNHRDVVSLNKMVEGDRFYFLQDRNKVKQVLISIKPMKQPGKRETFAAVTRQAVTHEHLKDKTPMHPDDKIFKNAQDVQAVFLRHENPLPNGA